jgi:hypothetical protein
MVHGSTTRIGLPREETAPDFIGYLKQAGYKLQLPYRIGVFTILIYYCAVFALCSLRGSTGVDPRFKLTLHEDENSPTGIYIPKDLDDCHAELERMLHPKARLFFGGKLVGLSKGDRYKFEEGYGHMGIGMWMRNNWGLWRGSLLAKYFNALGIKHPDDMSAIILSSYRARLLNRKYDLDTDMRMFKKYWAMMAKPPDFTDPKTGGRISIPDSPVKYFTKGMVIHEGINKKTGEVWFFVHDRGWYKPSNEELEAVKSDSVQMESFKAA